MANSSGDGHLGWWAATGERELRAILFWRWDPIGVSDLYPWSYDEYHVYTAQIMDWILLDPSPRALERKLAHLVKEDMEVPAEDGFSEVSALLVRWYQESRRRWVEFGPLEF